jgi:hypothetical protein
MSVSKIDDSQRGSMRERGTGFARRATVASAALMAR